MQRRDFLALGGLGMGSFVLPSYLGKAIAAEQLLSVLDVSAKKPLADAALPRATCLIWLAPPIAECLDNLRLRFVVLGLT